MHRRDMNSTVKWLGMFTLLSETHTSVGYFNLHIRLEKPNQDFKKFPRKTVPDDRLSQRKLWNRPDRIVAYEAFEFRLILTCDLRPIGRA